MPHTKTKTKSKPRSPKPSADGRTVLRVTVTPLRSELAEMDALAYLLAPAGRRPNRTAAAVAAIRAVRQAEARGLVTVGPDGIQWVGAAPVPAPAR